MRHQKHKNQLGVKKEHRLALTANLASALIKEGRITTTLKKAKAIRPFAEKMVTLAKKGTLHHRRIAVARLRDKEAVQVLFDDKAADFAKRKGGYTRIYKLGNRIGDAAEMAIIEWVGPEDEGYKSTRRKKGGGKAKSAAAPTEQAETATAESEQPEEGGPAAAQQAAEEPVEESAEQPGGDAPAAEGDSDESGDSEKKKEEQ